MPFEIEEAVYRRTGHGKLLQNPHPPEPRDGFWLIPRGCAAQLWLPWQCPP